MHGLAFAFGVACSVPTGTTADTPAEVAPRRPTDSDPLHGATMPGLSRPPERCNGIDDDLDGEVDEGLDEVWYLDADGDGFGSPEHTQLSCAADEGWVANALDCDDTDPETHPEAAELCDGFDNDCDGAWDEDPADPVTFFEDLDGDGYGNPAVPIEACWATESRVWIARDCDDGDAEINPSALDICGDGLDQDCSGRADNGCTWLTEGDTSIHLVDERSSAGIGLGVGDYDGDGIADLAVGIPMYPTYGSGLAHVVRGPVAAMNGALTDNAAASIAGEWKEGVGYHLASGVDMNADGVDDIVAQPGKASEMWAFLGPVAGELGTDDADIVVDGGDLSYSWTSTGDLDLDGFTDLVIGAPAWDGVGATFILNGPVTADVALTTADAAVLSTASDSFYGFRTEVVPDTNGDGLADIATTSIWTPEELTLFLGPVTGALTPADANASITKSSYSHNPTMLGASLGSGDINGDGLGDIVVGAPSEDTSSGALYVFLGPISGTDTVLSAHARIAGDDTIGRFGQAVSVGEVDGDGHDDIATVGYNTGDGYLVYGPITGEHMQSSFYDVGFTVDGARPVEALIADIDADGLGDILFGDVDEDGVFGFLGSELP